MELPKGTYRQRKPLADGSIAIYIRDRGTGKRIEGELGTPEFDASLKKIREGAINQPAAESWGALVVEFKRSGPFREYKAITQGSYERDLARLRAWETFPVKDIRARDFLVIRDSIALETPAMANKFIHNMAKVMSFAVEREYRETNPLLKVKPLKGGTHETWTEAQITYALKAFPERFRRAVLLALYTGQRSGDCVAMTWEHYDGTAIQVKQEKTGADLWVPVHRVLRAALDRWRADSPGDEILTNIKNEPWSSGSFQVSIHHEIKLHAKLAGMVFHGLRKAAATRLAEAGCSSKEIGSITGHTTLAMVELYTRKSDQKRHARAAMNKLELVKE